MKISKQNKKPKEIEVIEYEITDSLCYEPPEECGGGCCDNDCHTDSCEE